MPRLIAMLGPSGAGKDSLLDYARARMPDLYIQKRVITRPPHPDSEDYISVDDAGFAAMDAAGEFLFRWKAHGVAYGIPSSCLDAMADGRVAVFNGSRSAFPRMREARPDLEGVWIEVSVDILASRLAERGRESLDDITKRLLRQAPLPPEGATVISNNGALEDAGNALVEFLSP